MSKEKKDEKVEEKEPTTVIDAVKELTKQITSMTKELKDLKTQIELKVKAGRFVFLIGALWLSHALVAVA
jgi:hypothetical protein